MLTRRRFLLALLAVLALAGLRVPSAVALGRADRVHVVVLHTNDLHGQVLPRKATWLGREDPPDAGGLARVAAAVKRLRVEAASQGRGIVVVDAGDWFQGTPEGAVDDGLPFVAAMAAVGYDAMCIGNHELDLGLPNLLRILRETKVPAVLSNVRDKQTGKSVDWAPSYRIVETAGLRIGIVGLLSPITPTITHADARRFDFVAPEVVLEELRRELEDEVDYLLVLTHMGVRDDERLAEAHPDLPLIVGGHSHTFLKEGLRRGETLIVQTGSKAGALGRVDLAFERATKRLVEAKACVVDLHDVPAEADRNTMVEDRCDELVARTRDYLDVVVGRLGKPLVRSREGFRSSNAGNLITDTMREHTGAHVAIHNRGGIRCDLEAGEVTRRHLFELLPFGNTLVTVTLTGSELAELVREAVTDREHSGLELSGMRVDVDAGDDGTTVEAIWVGGERLDPKASYRVSTNSFLAGGGDGYGALARGRDREEGTLLLREVLERRFVREGTVEPAADDRYRVLEKAAR
jgi:5'-nucleotidase